MAPQQPPLFPCLHLSRPLRPVPPGPTPPVEGQVSVGLRALPVLLSSSPLGHICRPFPTSHAGGRTGPLLSECMPREATVRVTVHSVWAAVRAQERSVEGPVGGAT